jgi:DNA-binding NarL/FixJ family response regulator
MKKITIKDVERAIQTLKTEDIYQISPKDDTDGGKWAEDINNKLDIELAKNRLTHKERQIIELIEIGYSYKQIEEEFGINPKTVRCILDKMGK